MTLCYLSQGVPDLSEHGDVYELGFGLGPENPPTSALIRPEFRRELLYHMSPQQVYLYFISYKSITIQNLMYFFGVIFGSGYFIVL